MVKMRLVIWVRHENENEDWYFYRMFDKAPAKPNVGESLDIGGDGCYERVNRVVHNLKEDYLEVTCECEPIIAAHYFMDYDDWIIDNQVAFQKDEAILRKYIEGLYDDATPVFTFKNNNQEE